MTIPPILPINGVPEELLRLLNDRFRQLAANTSAEVSAKPATGIPEVRGVTILIHAGAIPKVAAGTLTESSLTDDGSVVRGTEPLAVDTGTTPAVSQLQLSANGLGALQLLSYAADNQEILFDCIWDGSALLAAHTETMRVVKTNSKLSVYGATGQTVGDPVTDVELFSIDLATGNSNTIGVYKVNGTQVVGAPGLAITAASAYGGGVAGGTYNAAVQTLLNAAITQILNLKARLDDLESRLQAHGLIA